jgi:UDP-hydrolysing UDP-N-acetyl-D-glucosamine 2-epimerase
VLQLGEDPEKVINSGAPGLEYLARFDRETKEELEAELGVIFFSPSYLVTWHPITREEGEGVSGLYNLLEVLRNRRVGFVIFTASNADNSGDRVNQILQEFVAQQSIPCSFVPSLGSERYWSVLHCVSAVVGNSSSGVIEAPSIPVGSINIGDRQKGRTRATSVIDCGSDTESISEAFDIVESMGYQKTLQSVINPYEKVSVSRTIVAALESWPLSELKRKPFFDI